MSKDISDMSFIHETDLVPNSTALSKGKQNDLLNQRGPRAFELATETVAVVDLVSDTHEVVPSSPTPSVSAPASTTPKTPRPIPASCPVSLEPNLLLSQAQCSVVKRRLLNSPFKPDVDRSPGKDS